MNDSIFYRAACQSLEAEIGRLDALCRTLDGNPDLKRERISEYKCTKYRYATVSVIHSVLCNCHRFGRAHKLVATRYLLLPFCEALERNPGYVALYDAAPEGEKPDFGLYYGIRAFAEEQLAGYSGKTVGADDWERIELSERMDGLNFTVRCLDAAWQKRGEARHE